MKQVREDRPFLGKESKQMKIKTIIKAGTLNLQGAWDTGSSGIGGGKLEEITRYMDQGKIDLLALQETKRPLNDVIKKNGYIFVFASSIENAKTNNTEDNNYQFRANKGKKKQKQIGSTPHKGKGKGKGHGEKRAKGKSHGKGKRKKTCKANMETEWHGVGFAYKEEFEKCREFYKQIGSREIAIQFSAAGGPIKFTNYYAPQSGRPPNERTKFYDEMSDKISKGKKYVKNIYLGDFNARLHGRRRHEEGVVGNFIFGKGLNYIERKSVDRKYSTVTCWWKWPGRTTW